jgi:hypothetical protein
MSQLCVLTFHNELLRVLASRSELLIALVTMILAVIKENFPSLATKLGTL